MATRLGGVFAQSFCEVAARSVASPFVLFSLAVESAKVGDFPLHIVLFIHDWIHGNTDVLDIHDVNL